MPGDRHPIPTGASPQEILAVMLPLVVETATESTARSVEVVAALSKLEARVDELVKKYDANMGRCDSFREELERHNDQREEEKEATEEQEKQKEEQERQKNATALATKKMWHTTMRATVTHVLTPAFLIQMLLILLGLAGIYLKLPSVEMGTEPGTRYYVVEPSTPAPQP